MTWVKVCGMQEEADIAAALSAGADAIGVVLAAGSPRQVSVERAASLFDGVPLLRILVTAHLDPDLLAETMASAGADGIQAHGRHAAETAAAGAAAGWFVLRPVAMGTVPPEPDPASVPERQIPILDSSEGRRLGGTGIAFDWELAGNIGRPFVLAGGLSRDNVRRAIDTLEPWGVDASSGLESVRGVKDTGKVVAFIEEAKRA